MEIYITLQNTNESYLERGNSFSYLRANTKENYNYLVNYMNELIDEHYDDDMMVDNNLHTRLEREFLYNKKQIYYEYPSFYHLKRYNGICENYG